MDPSKDDSAQVLLPDVLKAKIFCHVERSRDISYRFGAEYAPVVRRTVKRPISIRDSSTTLGMTDGLQASLITHSPTQFLQRCSLSFCFQNLLLERPRSRRTAAALMLPRSNLLVPPIALCFFERIQQPFPRELSVTRLRSGILDRHRYACRHVAQPHRGRHLVYILASRA